MDSFCSIRQAQSHVCISSLEPYMFQYQIASLESIQRLFTKYLPGFTYLGYEQCLKSLKALSLEDIRMMADIVFEYKMLHNMCDKKIEDVGLSPSAGNERNGTQRLYQHRAKNRQSGTVFKYRVPSLWNNLSSRVSTAPSLKQFKSWLYKHLMHAAQAARLDDA